MIEGWSNSHRCPLGPARPQQGWSPDWAAGAQTRAVENGHQKRRLGQWRPARSTLFLGKAVTSRAI